MQKKNPSVTRCYERPSKWRIRYLNSQLLRRPPEPIHSDISDSKRPIIHGTSTWLARRSALDQKRAWRHDADVYSHIDQEEQAAIPKLGGLPPAA